jgi:hypothetical protein
VVAVDANGNIYGRKTGKAWIYATTYNGKRAACKVVVRKAPKRVYLSAGSMAVCVDETLKLTASLPRKTALFTSFLRHHAYRAFTFATAGAWLSNALTITLALHFRTWNRR